MELNRGEPGAASDILVDAEMAECFVLLPRREAEALERMAQACGLTVGQLLRRLVAHCLHHHEGRRAGSGVRREPGS